MTVGLVTGTSESLDVVDDSIRRHGVVRRTLREPAALISVIFLVIVLLAAIFAPLLTPYDPTATKLADVLAPPFTPEHPLGADGVGRDVLANLLYGAQTSLSSAAIVVAVSLLIGVPAGLLAGYRRGWIDGTAMWISGAADVTARHRPPPGHPRASRPQHDTGTGRFRRAHRAIGVPARPRLGSGVREELYVDAAQVSGLRDARIMRRHILPVVITPTIIQAALLASAGIGIEAGHRLPRARLRR